MQFLQTGISNDLSAQDHPIAGESSSISVGRTLAYVSQVGTTTASSGVSQTTVSQDKVLSGLKMKLTCDIDGGLIYTDIEISVADLVKMTEFEALGTKIFLPETVDRMLKTRVRVKPGDTILLGGLNVAKDDSTTSGLPGPDRLLSLIAKLTRDVIRTEMVIVLAPRIIRFSDEPPVAVAVPPAGEQKQPGDGSQGPSS